MRHYYPLAIELDGSTRWLIWFDDDPDGVVCADGTIMSFLSVEQLSRYANEHCLELDESDAVFNLDRALAWESEPNVVEALNCWNLVTDVASSLQQPFDDRGPAGRTLTTRCFEP